MDHSTRTLTDEILDEFYRSQQLQQQQKLSSNRKNAAKKPPKPTKTIRLEPLQQSVSSENIVKEERKKDLLPSSKSVDNIRRNEAAPLLLPEKPKRKEKLEITPEKKISEGNTNIEDMHYLSHMRHRAAGVSGLSPDKSPSPAKVAKASPSYSSKKTEKLVSHPEEKNNKISSPKQNEEVSPEPVLSISPKRADPRDNHRQLNQRVEDMQFQLLEESKYLSILMQSVIDQHESLKKINDSVLLYRKEIGLKVQEINDSYVQLFEQMLQEVMKIQRLKFKSQTKLVEDYRRENERVVQIYTIALQEKESLAKQLEALQQEKVDINQYNTSLLQQMKEIDQQNQSLQLSMNALTIENQRLHQLSDEVVLLKTLKQRIQQLEQNLSQRESTILSLTQRHQQEIQRNQEAMSKQSEEIRLLQEVNAKNSVFNNLDKIPFQFPRVEASTQTEITEDGLWDSRQGWVLPISKTALARQRWRKAFSFARCPSCRGIGGYILLVQSLLKKCLYGLNSSIEMLSGEEQILVITPERLLKWRMPDAFVIFLNNLPITVQAKRPKSLLWTIQHLLVILQGKFVSEEEDDRLNYRIQSLVDYLIEQSLRNHETRLHAELEIYELLVAIKEYYLHHPLVLLFARALGVVDDLTPTETAAFLLECKKNEEALLRKKKKEYEHLSSRQRNKLLSEWKDQQQTSAVSSSSKSSASYYSSIIAANTNLNQKNNSQQLIDREFVISDGMLSVDILRIVLFARQCCLSGPYEGVYATPIQRIFNSIHHSSTQHLPIVQKQLEYQKKLKQVKQTFWTLQSSPQTSNSEDRDEEGGIHEILPWHLFCDVSASTQFQHYLPLDRAIHVLHPFLSQLSASQIVSIYRLIEDNTRCLGSDGSIYLPEGLKTFIRSTMRLFIYSLSEQGEDIPTWEQLRQRYHHPSDEMSFQILQQYSIDPTSFSSANPLESAHSSSTTRKIPDTLEHKGKKKNQKKNKTMKSKKPSTNSIAEESDLEDDHDEVEEADNSHHDHSVRVGIAFAEEDNPLLSSVDRIQLNPEELSKFILVTNLDFFLTIIAELIRYQLVGIELRLREIFEEGDINHDHVLSFDEFKAIVHQVKPDFPDRTVLRMFREALTSSAENKDCIGPDAFVHICKEYHLFEILNLPELKNQLRALWYRGSAAIAHEAEEEEGVLVAQRDEKVFAQDFTEAETLNRVDRALEVSFTPDSNILKQSSNNITSSSSNKLSHHSSKDKPEIPKPPKGSTSSSTSVSSNAANLSGKASTVSKTSQPKKSETKLHQPLSSKGSQPIPSNAPSERMISKKSAIPLSATPLPTPIAVLPTDQLMITTLTPSQSSSRLPSAEGFQLVPESKNKGKKDMFSIDASPESKKPLESRSEPTLPTPSSGIQSIPSIPATSTATSSMTAKLNESLSRESSQKMLSILTQRKQQRMQEMTGRYTSLLPPDEQERDYYQEEDDDSYY